MQNVQNTNLSEQYEKNQNHLLAHGFLLMASPILVVASLSSENKAAIVLACIATAANAFCLIKKLYQGNKVRNAMMDEIQKSINHNR